MWWYEGMYLIIMYDVYFVHVGKVVLLKDLSNFTTKLNSDESRNDLDECVKWLKDTYGKPCVNVQLTDINFDVNPTLYTM